MTRPVLSTRKVWASGRSPRDPERRRCSTLQAKTRPSLEIAVSVEDGHPEREDRALNDRRDADTHRRLVRATDFLEDNVADPRGASAVVGAGDRIAIGGHGPEADYVRVRRFTALEQRVLVVGAECEEPGHRGDQLHRRVMQADVVGNILGERAGDSLLMAQLFGASPTPGCSQIRRPARPAGLPPRRPGRAPGAYAASERRSAAGAGRVSTAPPRRPRSRHRRSPNRDSGSRSSRRTGTGRCPAVSAADSPIDGIRSVSWLRHPRARRRERKSKPRQKRTNQVESRRRILPGEAEHHHAAQERPEPEEPGQGVDVQPGAPDVEGARQGRRGPETETQSCPLPPAAPLRMYSAAARAARPPARRCASTTTPNRGASVTTVSRPTPAAMNAMPHPVGWSCSHANAGQLN